MEYSWYHPFTYLAWFGFLFGGYILVAGFFNLLGFLIDGLPEIWDKKEKKRQLISDTWAVIIGLVVFVPCFYFITFLHLKIF
tara:strand:+ start:370 stop:615 length:246 start_codon:yes stop_codon:yes gene_type:complete